LVLIADFGGGTSDFSLLMLGPSFRDVRGVKTPPKGTLPKGAGTTSRARGTRTRGTREILGTDGVAIAGNDFDSVLVRHLVAPRLGLGTEYRSLGKLLPVPRWIYKEFERWHYLSFLKTRQTMETLESIKTEALEPKKIEQLIHVIDEELGFQLYSAIERTMVELSVQQSSTFVFKDWRVEITEQVTRSQFEAWISSYLTEMSDCIERLLESCNVAPAEVDSVFMTGGSSLVPPGSGGSLRKSLAPISSEAEASLHQWQRDLPCAPSRSTVKVSDVVQRHKVAVGLRLPTHHGQRTTDN
jgi:hypothetical chaperone protein